MKPRLAITALIAFSLLLTPTGVALATGSGKQHADKSKDGKKHADKDAARVEYGHDDKPKGGKPDSGDTLIPPGSSGGPGASGAGGGPGAGSAVPGGGGPSGAGSAVSVGGATGTLTAPGAGAPGPTSTGVPGVPGVAAPGAGVPGAPTVSGPSTTTPGGPTPPMSGGPTTVTTGGPTGGDAITPGSGGPGTSPSEDGVAGDVASGGGAPNLDDTQEAPSRSDVRAGEQVAAAGGSELAFTGFAAIPMLLVGLAVLTGGLLLRRSRSTT